MIISRRDMVIGAGSLALCALGSMVAPRRASAEQLDKMTLEEARDYLLSYMRTETNYEGEEYTVSYAFDSDQQLDEAAQMLMDMGADEFNAYIDDQAIKAVEAESSQQRGPETRMAKPSTIYKTVSGNGSHSISGSTSGSCDFGSHGLVEYTADIGVTVNVSNGIISSCNAPWFNVPWVSAGGQYDGKVTIPTGCNPGESASCTANFKINRVITIMDPISIVLGSSTEVVCLIAKQG